MSMSVSNDRGFFSFRGSIRDIIPIDPYLKIYHKCNYNGNCWKTRMINIPKHYIVEGNRDKVVKFHDTGVVEFNSTAKLVSGYDYSEDWREWYLEDIYNRLPSLPSPKN
ncbi:Transthyretin-like family protein [Ancylostoma duodenale]|uniref:Transthyretin-like family protein n=1 Tax=Ancylostoma duodenale TaxID=51022 RepID=A0A0C2FN36_9BILA|nr:Transthyretin-like family protein [Ancylostoma duodenale]